MQDASMTARQTPLPDDCAPPSGSTSRGGVQVAPGICIPIGEIRWKFSRAGGPGGQNVNKVETRVELLFQPGASRAFDEFQRKSLLERLANRLDPEGILHVVASEHRSQRQNREAALLRLQQILQEALRPRRVRRATRVPRAVREARLEEKRRRSTVKQSRRFSGED